MNCVDFGTALLKHGDLDPLYTVLWSAQLPRKQLGRFILAYSCLYHAGASAYCCESKDFWGCLDYLRRQGPRGTERRHWRGSLAIKSLESLSRETPENVLKHWFNSRDFNKVFDNVQQYAGFGPWIAFKIADLAERTGYAEVRNFTPSCLNIYSEPKKGAALFMYGDTERSIDDAELGVVVVTLQQYFSHYKAPPIYDRRIGVQEVETILCKWKSHMNGRYLLGKDTCEIFHHLHGWGDLADELERCPLL